MSAHDHVEYVEGCFRCELSRDEQRAARIAVIRAAARRMVDTDEHFYGVLAKWLLRRADISERYLFLSRSDVDAYNIAEAYLESEPRLRRRS